MKRLAAAALCMVIPVVSAIAAAQTSAGKPAPKPRAGAPQRKPTGSLAQIMRGIYFPNSNLIFDVQHHDPAVPLKKSETGGSATDTYSAAYTGWEVVENAAVALTDGVDLILMPGRSCQNGKPVPIRQADFQKYAREMRAAGLKVLAAARTKNQEKVSDATNDVADACSNCHEAYRNQGPAESPLRCTPPSAK
jgi:hypothetical protein